MKPTNRDRVFVADFPAEGAGLSEANMMGFARHPTADDTGQSGDELAVLPVAQANGLLNAAMARAAGPGQDDWKLRRRRPSERRKDFFTGALVPSAGTDCGSS